MQQNYRISRQRAADLEGINAFLKIERDKFETLAKRDALTGCLNRNGVRDVLNQVLQNYKKFKQQSTLILFDIDHFKKVNDRFGHEEGDVILKSLAQLVRKHIRDSDHFVRWGGEEFLIVSEQTSLMGGISLAEHLREQITNAKLSEDTNVTASFGVAPLNSAAIDQWFRQADEALYDAKARGRNCVVAYSAS
nr:GGDEF domain-containing protein [Reinekea sp. G2M2-21]